MRQRRARSTGERHHALDLRRDGDAFGKQARLMGAAEQERLRSTRRRWTDGSRDAVWKTHLMIPWRPLFGGQFQRRGRLTIFSEKARPLRVRRRDVASLDMAEAANFLGNAREGDSGRMIFRF